MSVIKPCEMCGKEYEFPRKNGRFCPECRLKKARESSARLQRKYGKQYRQNRRKKEQEIIVAQAKRAAKSKRQKENLNDVIKKANEAGLSYGRYVSMMERKVI